MTDALSSSDSIRSARPLAHAKTWTSHEPLVLEHGATLPQVDICYETYGELNAERDNAVLLCHAISGDSHVARHHPDDDPGWWEQLVGPGKPVDTNHYFVICSNVLGGCRGTTGPGSINPDTGKPYGNTFPLITIGDMVAAQTRLIDHLGIDQLRAVVGGSLGGHQGMIWSTRYPERVANCIAIATSPRLNAQALAFDVVARNAILSDQNYQDGQYYAQPNKPDIGLAIARMLGHITYLSPEAMQSKFDADRLKPHNVKTAFEKKFSVGSYLAYQGDKFVERFDANSYITLSMAMDLLDLGSTPEALAETLKPATCDWTVISFSSDWLFTPQQSRQIVDALLKNDQHVTYAEVPSEAGHDGFLLQDEISRFGRIVAAKLSTTDVVAAKTSDENAAEEATPTIYASHRFDYEQIAELVPANASVLDVGCGRGGLFASLIQRGHDPSQLVGIEVAEQSIITAVERGFQVIDHDVNLGLSPFGDQQFDVVVLSQTLQSVPETEHVISEILRVGKQGIVSFPNFGYKPLREMIAKEGRAPRQSGRYDYAWYNTPNRRFPTILDFDEFCEAKQIEVKQAIYLQGETGELVSDDPNLNADTAIYVISK